MSAKSFAARTRALSEAAIVEGDARWNAVRVRDRSADGSFFYSVRTTGVYCRPSCGARLPRPENVAFHEDRASAERAGFRPCRRCRPEQSRPAELDVARVTELCRLIENSSGTPTLAELARHAGLSVFHTQRLFKAVTGVTPRAYASAQRARRVRNALEERGSVTDAIYAAGYASAGHFYGETATRLGMTPSQYRSGGAQLAMRVATRSCSLGCVLVAATERGVCAILLGDDPQELARDLEQRFPRAGRVVADAAFAAWVGRVVELIEEPRRGAQLPLDIRGTAFQQRVWQALAQIPAGETRSYTELARAIGVPSAARAVARACAANPVAVATPCHRVLRGDGGMGGYRWGIERKRALLARESKR
jgi:AraC family transcriptional regulator of adaptative response/methylated-DNA-[protein]-cysteine methyltransferase